MYYKLHESIILLFSPNCNRNFERIQRSCNLFNKIILRPVVTDVGTELSVPMDMIMPNIPFSLLTAYQILAFDSIGNVTLV